jgi:hypothetical protein
MARYCSRSYVRNRSRPTVAPGGFGIASRPQAGATSGVACGVPTRHVTNGGYELSCAGVAEPDPSFPCPLLPAPCRWHAGTEPGRCRSCTRALLLCLHSLAPRARASQEAAARSKATVFGAKGTDIKGPAPPCPLFPH